MVGKALFALALILPAEDAVALCVKNATTETLHFTIERRPDGMRRAADLGPEGALCLPGVAGVVGVFETAASLEGCSRIAGPSGEERLVEFHRFDRCRWAAHDGG